MEYRPGSHAPIERFIQGAVTGVARTGSGISSPSIHRLDGTIDVEAAGDSTSSGKIETFRIAYDRQSYVSFDQVGRSYLFAIAEGVCVGFLPVEGDTVVLPDATLVDTDAYVRSHLNRPFPDYYGFDSEVVP